MIQKIVPVTNSILRKESKPVAKVDKKVQKLIQDLKDTLVAQKDPEGVGLAAPQIGKNVRIFAIKPKNKIKIIINPKVIKKSDEILKIKNTKKQKKDILEGCLSLPNYYGPLNRSKKITIRYLTEKGEKKTETFTGFPAQIVQHEIDHLNGVLFVDRLLENKQPLYELQNNHWQEVELA